MKIYIEGLEPQTNARGNVLLANSDHYHEMQSGLVLDIERIINKIALIDQIIDYCALILRIIQPNNHIKIGIRWWKLQLKQKRSEPVLVKWVPKKENPKEFNAIRIKRINDSIYTGINNAKHVKAVVDYFRALREERKRLFNRLAHLKNIAHIPAKKAHVTFKFADMFDEIKKIHEKAIEEMRATGFDAEERFLPDKIKLLTEELEADFGVYSYPEFYNLNPKFKKLGTFTDEETTSEENSE